MYPHIESNPTRRCAYKNTTKLIAVNVPDLDLLDQLRAKDKGLINRQFVWGWTLAHFAAGNFTPL
jgi:hypothetical protein